MINAHKAVMASAMLAGSFVHAGVPDPVAVYAFNGTLTSSVPGAPDLLVVNPGGDAFGTQMFSSRTTGTWSWPARTGLVLDTNGLLTGASWTVGITFRFDSTASYNKILDTQNRTLDFGWYNNPSFQLNYFPSGIANPQSFGPAQEVTVVITCDGSRSLGYLDGVFSVDTGVRPDATLGVDGLMHFFLDDLPFAGEVSSGTVASIFIWDDELDAAEVAGLLPLPQMIEPCNAVDQNIPFGIIDLADINKFVTNFLGMKPGGDLDQNGLFDLGDITAFVAGFTGGCP